MIDFSKFDKKFDTKGLKADLKEIEANGGTGEYKEVPYGKYEVKIEKMELGETGPKSKNPGSPMLKVQFRILTGEFKNSCIFMNQVITQAFQLHVALDFLKSLDSGIDITFDSFMQFSDLILDVHEAINGILEYGLNYSETSKGFKKFEITDVFDVNTDKDDVPF